MTTNHDRPPQELPHLRGTDSGLLSAVVAGEARLTCDQALELFHTLPLPTLGRWADARCRAIHGDTLRTYIIDRNINYTNVCTARCTFCAFYRTGKESDSYTLSQAQIHEKIAELQAIGGTQILMQGGMNPELPLDWYIDLLRSIKEKFPKIHVHAFSPPEFVEFVNFFDPPGECFADKVRWVMVRLREAGLDSLPGGGGEIFANPVRSKIGMGKCDAEAWLTVMLVAQELGMFTSATMMFGHIEGYADRIHHMKLVREWQDKALHQGREAMGRSPERTSGAVPTARRHSLFGFYKAFISWPFQRENTPLGRLRDWGHVPEEWDQPFPGDVVAAAHKWGQNPDVDYQTLGPTAANFGRRARLSGASDYLRTQAISRLMLDNIYSIGSSWVTMGPHVGQLGLLYGANDMGSVMMEENVVSSAGTTYCLDEAVLCRLIRDAGFIPAQRDNSYDILRIHDGPHSPDLRVKDWSEHRTRRLHVERAPKTKKPALGGPAELTVSAKR